MSNPLVLSSSAGKDSLLALRALQASGSWSVHALVSSFVADDRALVMHEVPERLVALQAASLRLPLARVELPRNPTNAEYEAGLAAALEPFAALGIRHVAFGDLFLADIRAYRDALLRRIGFEPVYPLWGLDTSALAERFVREGFRALTVCVDATRLGAEWAGRELDAGFFAALPAGVDPCGENGEFHTFVYDGPGFTFPVRFERGATATRGGFHYAPLAARAGEACARCGATFECGMKAGTPRCWCAAVPAVRIDPALAGCLCPRCLDAARH